MKKFSEFFEEQGPLDEGVIRAGSIGTFAARSTAAGNKADQEYKKGFSALNDTSRLDDLHKRLDRIDAALKALLRGQMYQRQQVGNHVAVDVAGHSIRSRRNVKR